MVRMMSAALLFAATVFAETGSLKVLGTGAECPLRRTDVRAEVAGFLARVTMTQEFENTARDRMEAVYAFPLPHRAAVDGMTLTVGTRVIKGKVLQRDEARAIYEAARDQGQQAALLQQERANLFTQHVAGIAPGEKVRVTLTWNERIPYEAGTFEWAFPMVVGPRYKSPVTAGYAAPGERAGHDINLEVRLDAGMPLEWVGSTTHEVTAERPSATSAVIRLRNGRTIPNKDFVLRYDAAGKRIGDAVLTHRTSGSAGYFSVILQPPDHFTTKDLTPKEIVFVLDTSGSMRGFPIEKAKEAMSLAIAALRPFDTFNVITFSGDTHLLFQQPRPATPENVSSAKRFLSERKGAGGTEMMQAIRAALEPSRSQSHLRIACFMTDGYVGNEAEILAAIRTYSGARVFAFGIGNAVNRYLLDRMAEEGRGEVQYVSLSDDGSAAARRFHERVRNPLLTDITVDWGSLPVKDVLPQRIPDLFAAKPIVIAGTYATPARGTIRIHGKLAGAPWSREISLSLPPAEASHQALPALWARMKVEALSGDPGTEAEVTRLGIHYGLMTEFTSFVAVEEKTITEGGKPRRVDVPLEMPDGVSYEGVFGTAGGAAPAVGAMRQIQGIAQSVATASYLPKHSAELRSAARIHHDLIGKTGSVRVQIWLRSKNEALLSRLKRLGFVLTSLPETLNVVIGRVDASKLAEIAGIAEVRWIAPAPK
ncbi:MAG TPA: VIT and VWA domain-containing protein [Bryobacteraceae bacterium]|nr:VIT and VWA domain-containing protein [Bryobacteraceae bacterium]